MGYLPGMIPLLAIAATALGLACALACNGSRCPVRIYWGRRLFLLIFMLVAAACVVMPVIWPRGVLPCGLAMGTLFLGMLWHPMTPAEESEMTS